MNRSSLPPLPLLGALVILAFATPSHATLNACAASKKQCVAKKTAALLKCHQLAEKKGLDPVTDPKVVACRQKAVAKFDGGAQPTKGCFAKLEAKYPGGCLTTLDTAALENTVDDFVTDVVSALDPGYPAPVTNACSVGKKQCVSKKAAALLACHGKNEKPPGGLAPAKFTACLAKARAKFDGGAVPAKGCFAKLEAKFPDCLTTLDTADLETQVDGFVDDVVCQLDAESGTCPLLACPCWNQYTRSSLVAALNGVPQPVVDAQCTASPTDTVIQAGSAGGSTPPVVGAGTFLHSDRCERQIPQEGPNQSLSITEQELMTCAIELADIINTHAVTWCP